ncbi:MAG: tetratricopeptide repeat protein [Ignavibacteria bacterium]|nr:tetratricopeptide repeat protein [Ignavibacteria bacterium]
MNRNTFYLISAIIFGWLSLTAFDCASTEITSAKLYIQQKNVDKALDVLQKEVTKNPRSEEGYYMMGVIYGDKEEYAKMLDCFDKASANGKVHETDIKKAKLSYWGQAFNRGANYFKQATTAPKDSSAIFYEKSANSFKMAIAIQPDSLGSYKNLSYVYMNMGRYDDATAPLQKMVDLKKDKDAYKLLGELTMDKASRLKEKKDSVGATKEYNNAIQLFEEARKAHPDDQDILTSLCNAYIAADKASVAMGTFKQLLEKDPTNLTYRYNYGVLLLGANDFTGAEAQFKEALTSDAEHLNSIYNLAVTYVKWGATLSKKADETGKEDPEVKAKYRAALPYLESYVQKKSNDVNVVELLGKVYSVLGMTEDAKKCFDKADKLRK